MTHLTSLNGEWNLEGIELETSVILPVSSESPPPVENAVIMGSYQEYLSDSSVTYQCRNNYMINGGETIRCNDGAWEMKTISCVRYCENLEDGKLMITSDVKEKYMEGESIDYRCNAPGAVIKGTASCISGSWSKSIECPALPCTVGELPTGLGISGDRPANNQVSGGQTLRFFCPDEYHLEGSAEIECLDTGDWKESFPTCSRRNGCGSPPPLTDGDTVGFPKPPYEEGATVEYTCLDKYTLKGVSFKTCVNGVWTGQMTCMKPCIVNAEMRNRHNVNFAYGDRNKLYIPHEDHLTFVCKRGTRQLHQEQMRKQCIDGQMDLPTCG